MMTLAQRVKSLHAKLESLKALTSGAEEAKSLAMLRDELHPAVEKLQRQIDSRTMLTAAGVTIDGPKELEPASRRAADLLDSFSVERTAASLKKGRTWRQLSEDVASGTNALTSAIMLGWKMHRENLFSGEAPQALRSQLAQTQSNLDALARYERSYDAFKATGPVPREPSQVEQAGRLARELTTITFDRDVPAEVKLFLEKVQSGGAPLKLLTPTVQAWLEKNGASDGYVVRASVR